MPINDQLYERFSATWRDDAGLRSIPRGALNPTRVRLLECDLETILEAFEWTS